MNPTLELKEARTEHDVLPLIRRRFSPRAFTSEPLTDDELLTLVEAAHWAPSSMNEQPWRFRYAHRGSVAFDALRATLSTGNQPWAPNAAAVIAISGMKLHARNQAPNATWAFDTGMAVGNLLAQATAMGIYGHLLGGFNHAAANEALGINTAEEGLICLLVLGRLGDADSLPEPFLTRERTPRSRKPLSEIAQRI
ncbi:MAG: nitroreductase family protein [Flavobacteriales bacterium]|jgi:nitroreductase|nr:MAG: nitroreductase family protein [Flavobacteriales bacterium]